MKQYLKMDEKHFNIQKKGDNLVHSYSQLEFETLFGIKYLPVPFFENQTLKNELTNSCPWLLQHTVIGQEHRSLGAFYHKALQNGTVADVEIRWINESMGYGLFAKNFIAKETFIGQYTGVVRKICRFKPRVNGYCMRIPTKFWSFGCFILDAESAGNELRFANHSDRPTMKPLCLIDKALVHIGFFTNCQVEQGEELTFNYGSDYWKYRLAQKK